MGSIRNYQGSPLTEEATAIRLGMLMAREAQWKEVEFHSDCKNIIDMILGKTKNEASVAVVLEDISSLKRLFNHYTFSFVNRSVNVVAHKLAKFAIRLVHDVEWEQDYPMWLQESTKKDVEVFTSFVPTLVLSS